MPMRLELGVERYVCDQDARALLESPCADGAVIDGDIPEMLKEFWPESLLSHDAKRVGFRVVELNGTKIRALQLDDRIQNFVEQRRQIRDRGELAPPRTIVELSVLGRTIAGCTSIVKLAALDRGKYPHSLGD
jgi:hypothetical protein